MSQDTTMAATHIVKLHGHRSQTTGKLPFSQRSAANQARLARVKWVMLKRSGAQVELVDYNPEMLQVYVHGPEAECQKIRKLLEESGKMRATLSSQGGRKTYRLQRLGFMIPCHVSDQEKINALWPPEQSRDEQTTQQTQLQASLS